LISASLLIKYINQWKVFIAMYSTGKMSVVLLSYGQACVDYYIEIILILFLVMHLFEKI